MRKNLFVKVSGDLCLTDEFINYLRQWREYFIVICVGGGTQINEAFRNIGIEPEPHGLLGREIPTFGLRQMARDILEKNQSDLQDKLAGLEINAVVTIPVLDIGSVLCHVNGDQMVRTAYIGFDKLIVITTTERYHKKVIEFSGLEKVKVVTLTKSP